MIVVGLEPGNWVAERIGGFFDPACMAAIGWRSADGRLIAGATYRDWNGVALEAQIAADRPLIRSFLRAIFDYPFVQLGARKIYVTVQQDNAESLNLARRMGFAEEARLKDASPGGDLIICTLRREDCRYLGGQYGQASVSPASA